MASRSGGQGAGASSSSASFSSASSSSSVSARGCSLRRVHLWLAWAAAAPLLLSAATGTAYRLARSSGAEKESVRWLMDLHTLRTFGLRWAYPLMLAAMMVPLAVTGMSMSGLYAWLRRAVCACGRRSRAHSGSRSLSHAVEQFERRQQQQQRGLLNGGGSGVADLAVSGGGSGAADEESEWSDADDSLTDSAFLSRRIPSAPGVVPRWPLSQRVGACLPRAFSWRWLHRALGTAAFAPLLVTAVTGAAYVWCADWLYLEKQEYRTLMYLHEGRYLEATGTLYVALLGAAVTALAAAGCVLLWGRLRAAGGSGAMPTRYISAPSVAYSAVSGGGGGAFLSPASGETRTTMARVHKAFDLDHIGDETEDEMNSPHF